jgi:hypothetical protein
VQVGHRDGRVELRQAGGMRQQVPHEHLLLARGRELRPVPGDRRVKVQVAAVGEDQRAQRDHRLGRGPDVGDRVLFPGLGLFRVLVAAPEVGDGFAVHENGRRRADVRVVQRLRECDPEGVEALVTGAVYFGHAPDANRGGQTIYLVRTP